MTVEGRTISNCLLILMLSVNIASAQKVVQGVTFPDKLGKDEKLMYLNGAGVRTKVFIKVYVAGLYLHTKNSNAAEIINADQPTAVRLQIISSLVTQDRMADAIIEGFEKATKGNTKSIEKEINTIVNIFKSDVIKVGDVFDIWYMPGKGVMASKNNKKYDFMIPGLEFKKTIFTIWLGNDPVEVSLKNSLLGK